MEFRNLTPFAALAYTALDTQDQEHHVVVMRVRYTLAPDPRPDRPHQYHPIVQDRDPPPLAVQDSFHGPANHASPRAESDLAPFKPRCDVLLTATAHAPGGQPTPCFSADLILRDPARSEPLLHKRLLISGRRVFEHRPSTGRVLRALSLGLARPCPWVLSEPAPLTRLPLRYEYAVGGQCWISPESRAARRLSPAHHLSPAQRAAHPDGPEAAPLAHAAWARNPLGLGFVTDWFLQAQGLNTVPAPQIEHPDSPLSAEDFWAWQQGRLADTHPALQAAGLGPLGRAWQPRLALAGTYDEAWLEERHPYLPQDFDMGYWNAAPPDQQIPYPPPDLVLETDGLSSGGRLFTRLPGHRALVLARLTNGLLLPLPLRIDTLHLGLEADPARLDVVWRLNLPVSLPLRVLEARFETDPGAPLLTLAPDSEATHPWPSQERR